MKAYYVNSQQGCVDIELERAFLFALNTAELTSSSSKVLLAIKTKQNTGWFGRLEYFKKFKIETLFRGIDVPANTRNVTTIISSVKDISPKVGDVVIYVSLGDEDTFYLDDKLYDKEVTCIAIPVLPNALNIWKSLWQAQIVDLLFNPISINNGNYPSLDCITEKALNQMDSASYKGNNNPSDEFKIKTILRDIHKYKNNINSNSIASYLVIHHNWKPSRARYVMELHNKLINNRIFQGGEKTGHIGRIKVWKQLCK